MLRKPWTSPANATNVAINIPGADSRTAAATARPKPVRKTAPGLARNQRRRNRIAFIMRGGPRQTSALAHARRLHPLVGPRRVVVLQQALLPAVADRKNKAHFWIESRACHRPYALGLMLTSYVVPASPRVATPILPPLMLSAWNFAHTFHADC